MASTIRMPQDENSSTALDLKMLAATPKTHQTRKPLVDIAPNVVSPSKTKTDSGVARASLKRSAVSILDSDKGFSYLKRRRLSSEPKQRHPILHARPEHASTTTTRVTTSVTTLTPASKIAPSITPTLVQKPLLLSEAAQQLLHVDDSTSDDDDDSGDEAASRDSSQRSFNSLINYDPSSQPTTSFHYQHRLVPAAIMHGKGGGGGGGSGVAGLLQTFPSDRAVARGGRSRDLPGTTATRAQTLSARLRVAVYKVLTGQVHTPFAKLRVLRGVAGWPCSTTSLPGLGSGLVAGESVSRVEHGVESDEEEEEEGQMHAGGRGGSPAERNGQQVVVLSSDGQETIVAGSETPRL